jgi:hypothetical protein
MLGVDWFAVEALTSSVVVVRAIGGAWWRSVMLSLALWADRRMQVLSR